MKSIHWRRNQETGDHRDRNLFFLACTRGETEIMINTQNYRIKRIT